MKGIAVKMQQNSSPNPAIKIPFHTKSNMYLKLGEPLNEDGRKELNRKRPCLSFRRKTVQNLSQLLMPWCNELNKFSLK